MKKSKFFLPLFAALAFSACSSEDPIDNGGGQSVDNGEASYLAVNIVTAQSRAENIDIEGKRYEDGTANENTVKSVRFYFFDKDGNAEAVKVNANGYTNYHDWDPADDTNKGQDKKTGTVEKMLNPILIIETKKGDLPPAKMLVVVNPDKSALADATNKSLNTVRDIVANYASIANNDKSFVMTNSVYLTAAKEVMDATNLTAENFKTTEAEAKNNPIYVYVERNVAKVRVESNISANEKGLITLTKTKGGEQIKISETPVFVQLKGWRISGDLDSAYLSKHIKEDWTDQSLKFTTENWNHPAFFRSYWADEYANEKNENQYANFSATTKEIGTDYFTYCNENAERAEEATSRRKPTQVLIPAMLCDENGNPLHIFRFAGREFTDNETFDGLKGRYIQYLNNNQFYRIDDKGDKIDIALTDIEFKTAKAVGKTETAKENNGHLKGAYYVHASLSEEGIKHKWAKILKEGDKEVTEGKKKAGEQVEATPDEVEKVLNDMPHASIWKGGQTYYFFDIKHLNGQSGVVRNHLYDIELTELYGLGTPVFDENEVIHPEKTEEEDTYIAAQIKILSWRVVPSTVVLDWNNRTNNK